MRKFVLFITLGLLIGTHSAIGDSWSAYTSEFSFANDKLNLNVKLPKGKELVKAYPIRKDKVLVISRNSYPLTDQLSIHLK